MLILFPSENNFWLAPSGESNELRDIEEIFVSFSRRVSSVRFRITTSFAKKKTKKKHTTPFPGDV